MVLLPTQRVLVVEPSVVARVLRVVGQQLRVRAKVARLAHEPVGLEVACHCDAHVLHSSLKPLHHRRIWIVFLEVVVPVDHGQERHVSSQPHSPRLPVAHSRPFAHADSIIVKQVGHLQPHVVGDAGTFLHQIPRQIHVGHVILRRDQLPAQREAAVLLHPSLDHLVVDLGIFLDAGQVVVVGQTMDGPFASVP